MLTHQEIKELAGHRAVTPWVMKLVGDAISAEREACAKVCDAAVAYWEESAKFESIAASVTDSARADTAMNLAEEIRARGETT
jgi:hypothetical protein